VSLRPPRVTPAADRGNSIAEEHHQIDAAALYPAGQRTVGTPLPLREGSLQPEELAQLIFELEFARVLCAYMVLKPESRVCRTYENPFNSYRCDSNETGRLIAPLVGERLFVRFRQTVGQGDAGVV